MSNTRKVDKRRYYFSIDAYGKIIDAYFADYRSSYERDQVQKAIWTANFKLYNETENILKKVEDPNNFELFPLYRGIGQDDEDFLFNSREEALKEYEDHINQSIADRLYDL